MLAIPTVVVSGFRSLYEVILPLNDVSVLVGPNGAGKSNLLDVFRFLGDTARHDLALAIAMRGGWDRVRFRGAGTDLDDMVVLMIEARVTEFSTSKALDDYHLAFFVNTKEGKEQLFRSEQFAFKRRRGPGRRVTVRGAAWDVFDAEREKVRMEDLSRRWLKDRFDVDIPDAKGHQRSAGSLDPRSTALSTLGKLGDNVEGARQFRALAELLTTLRVFDVNVPLVRQPMRLLPEGALVALSPDASNLAPWLAWIQNVHPEIFQQVEEDLARIVPGVTRLHLTPLGGAAAGAVVEIEEKALKGRTMLADASFGTVRALGLLAMLHDPNPPRMTCVEELDHGLHPYALDLLVERVREASARSQMLLATHSPALVARLDPSEIIVCERDPETGRTRMPAIEPDVVRQKAKASGLNLGELWFSGSLGGVPQT